MLRRKCQIAAKVEATKGSLETLAAADAGILAEVVSWKVNAEPMPRSPIRATLSRIKSLPGVKTMTLDCKVEIKGSGTAATPPSFGVLLRGCGFSQTIAANVIYAPDSDDADSSTLTMCARIDGKNYLMYGARGNVKFSGTANQIMYAEFSFQGIFSAESDTALFTGVTYETTTPAAFRNSACTFNFGTAWTTSIFSQFELDLGNSVSLRSNANSATGLAYAQIVDRDPNGSFDLDLVLKATQDLYSYWHTPTTGSLAMNLGSAAGNTIAFAAPALQITDITEGDRDGVATAQIAYHLRGSAAAGEDELTITHS